MTEGLESLGRIRLQGLVLLAVAFAVGGLAGAAGERVRASRAEAEAVVPRRAPGPVPRFLERLDLTEEQRDAIARILRESRPRTDSLMNEWLPRVRGVMDSVHREIRAVLTPEQRERLDEMGWFRRGRGPGRMGPRGRMPSMPPPPGPGGQ